MSHRRTGATGALAFSLLLLQGAAHADVKDVPYTQTPVQLSGALSQFPPASKLFTLNPKASGPSDNTSSFYALWDDQYLYFGVEVADTALCCTAEPRDSQSMWSNDGVELNFDTKNKKALTPADPDFRQWILPINWSNNPYDAYGSGATGDAASFTSNIEVTVTLQGTLNDANADTGYLVIARIPWGDLAMTPANGLSFGFDGAVNDIDQPAGTFTFQDWANLNPFAQPDKWSSLALAGKGASPTDGAPRPGSDGLSRLDRSAAKTDARSGRPVPNSCDCGVATGAPRGVAWTLSSLALVLLALVLLAPGRRS